MRFLVFAAALGALSTPACAQEYWTRGQAADDAIRQIQAAKPETMDKVKLQAMLRDQLGKVAVDVTIGSGGSMPNIGRYTVSTIGCVTKIFARSPGFYLNGVYYPDGSKTHIIDWAKVIRISEQGRIFPVAGSSRTTDGPAERLEISMGDRNYVYIQGDSPNDLGQIWRTMWDLKLACLPPRTAPQPATAAPPRYPPTVAGWELTDTHICTATGPVEMTIETRPSTQFYGFSFAIPATAFKAKLKPGASWGLAFTKDANATHRPLVASGDRLIYKDTLALPPSFNGFSTGYIFQQVNGKKTLIYEIGLTNIVPAAQFLSNCGKLKQMGRIY